ncbi:MAG: helix-turn-helix domain-containing protein [Anaerolineales bacterium]|nr:helix-turn-helix domain-containing protein [Anaerolineales bacterium]
MEELDEMLDGRMTLLNAREAAQYLRVSLFTLSRIERGGGLVPFRTPGGHRRYSMRMLHEYLENSRNSWNPGGNATQRQQRAANPKDIERSQLELVQA